MADAVTVTAPTWAWSATTVIITGSMLGMQYDDMLFGLCGSLIALSKMPKCSKINALSTTITGTTLAGLGAPIISMMLINHFPGMAALGDVPSHIAAFSLGGGWLFCLPLLWEWAKKKIMRS